MKPYYNLVLLMCLLPALAFAGQDKFKGKYTKEKTINKEYTVNSDALLQVDNRYGNLDIVTWSGNRTVITVTIKTNGNNEAKVKERLNDITVDFSASAARVTAKTKFKDKNSSWSSWGKKNKNVAVEVNYKIQLPVGNSVDLKNDYGAISLTELKGNAKINCDYGQVNIGKLMAENNLLNMDYSKDSTIGYMKSGKVQADYSEFTLERTERVEVDADYSRATIKEAQYVNFNCDYGKMTIGSANTVIGLGDYIPSRIGTVTGSLNINTDYGSVHVERLENSVKGVTIAADYASIKLGLAPNFNFDFSINLSYAGLKGQEGLTITERGEEKSKKQYSGYRGKQNSGNTININSSYGGVTFN
ncbi:MAG: hypothetical protein ACPG7E_02690 [Marinirhabdus sp.]